MNSLCIFCGSSEGRNPKFKAMASELGSFIGQEQMKLVYGGASIGLMGTLADNCLKSGGEVYGIIPKFLRQWEVAHDDLTELIEVDSMHERKLKMYELSDLFLAIPGGIGTLDELCEIATWSQLKLHRKHIIIFNFEGFFDGLISHFDNCVQTGFLSSEHREIFQIIDNIDDLKKVLRP